MKFFSYLRVELNRIFHSKIVCLIMVLTMLCPMAGYKLYNNDIGIIGFQTLSGDFIMNPAMAGTLGGGTLFALLILLEFDRVHKHKTEELTNSIVSPLIFNVIRVVSIGIAAIVSVSITAVVYFPYTAMKLGKIFESYTYWNSFFLLMLPSVLLSILVASAFYQIFCRVDLSMAAFIAFTLGSFSELFGANNILHWMKPSVPALSDYFGNTIVFRLMQHNRLFWFLVLGGLWFIGLLCVRQYGKGLFGSVLHNIKKAYIPVMAVALISCGFYTYINQPYVYQDFKVDDSDELNNQLELYKTDLEISLDAGKGSISGNVSYSIKNLSGSIQECKLIINPGHTVRNIMVNGKEITFKNLNSSIVFSVPNDPQAKLFIEYSGVPKIRNSDSDLLLLTPNISDKYVYLDASYMCPSIRVANSKENSKITGKITMPAKLTPIIEGMQVSRDHDKLVRTAAEDKVKLISEDGDKKTWLVNVDGNKLNLIAGDYVVKNIGNEEMPVQLYYNSKIEDDMKNMRAEEVMKDTINYCTAHYGKLNKVTKNSSLKIVQYAVLSFGMAGPNFSVAKETCFSDKNLNDKLTGATNADTLAHEISHQWWSFQTVDEGGDSGSNWSCEGLATYTTYRIAKEKYGEEYAQKNYVDEWNKFVKEEDDAFYTRHPEYLDILPPKYADMIEDDRSVRLYFKMGLKFLKASKLVGGDDKMDSILAELYKKSEKSKITWQDFLDACELKEEDLNLE